MKIKVVDLFQSLTVKNYRLYFAGQGVSLIGTWMQRTTMGWFVYRLTDSPFLLGLIMFFSQIPSVFIGPFAGVWADKWSRLSIIKLTQSLALIQALVLATLVLTNTVQIWHVITLSLISGVVEAVDAPARQSFVIELVQKRSLLPNAIALNSAMFNGARLIGPSLAGFLIAVSNEGYCFLINGLSYIAVIISLFIIKVPARHFVESQLTMLKKIKQGWSYSFSHMPIKYLLANVSIITMFGMSYNVLMPIFARDILSGTSRTLGYLMSMVGVGALAGAIYLASRKSIKGLSRMMVYGLSMLSLAMIFFSLSRNLALSMGLMLFLGFGMMFQMSASNTILQSVVADDMRGRVMSLHAMAFMSVAPFGSLLAGFLSKHIGAPMTLAISAMICLGWSACGFTLQDRFVGDVDTLMQKHEPEPSAATDITELALAVTK